MDDFMKHYKYIRILFDDVAWDLASDPRNTPARTDRATENTHIIRNNTLFPREVSPAVLIGSLLGQVASYFLLSTPLSLHFFSLSLNTFFDCP